MDNYYRRFETARLALEDCLYALYTGEDLSIKEGLKGEEMFLAFLNYCVDMKIIDDYDWDVTIGLFETRMRRALRNEKACSK